MEVAVLFHRWSLDSSETTANLAGKKNLRLALVATNQIVDSRMIWKAKPYDSVRAETKNGNKKNLTATKPVPTVPHPEHFFVSFPSRRCFPKQLITCSLAPPYTDWKQ